MEGKDGESKINWYCITTIIYSFIRNLWKKINKVKKGEDMSEWFNKPVDLNKL